MKKELAHYEIMNQLGAGGMGEVYLARDTKLGRSVAVKVLPEIFAQDADRVSRFQREAKLLAALNHSNIASLFGLEEDENRHFLVMELIEGETLAEMIARAPIGPEQALKIAQQIAEAFEYAHEKGIIHRDLKPANVKVTPEGKVKVLDFGLAKAMESVRPNTNMSNSPTLSMSATNAGVVLGTAAYMSPEQARGFDADPRSDIFSFGCILYEMITGRQAFQGDTVADVLAGVLAREPDLALLPANLNPRITELLRRCVEKNPKRRWHAIADARVEIEAILGDTRGLVIKTEPVSIQKPLWKRAIPILVAASLAAAGASVATWYFKPQVVGPVTKFSFAIPEGQQFTNTGRQVVAISPDGTQFVYVANTRLYLKSMRELNPMFIQGTEIPQGILNPVFSPDGKSLVFFSNADQTLKRISVSGGAPVTICAATSPFGMTWGADDQIFVGLGTAGIARVSAMGGSLETIIKVQEGEAAHGPQLLPDGKTILYTLAPAASADRWAKGKIVVQAAGSDRPKVVVEGGSDARYVPTGHLIYALQGTILAVPFDTARLERIGGPVPIVEGVQAGGATGTSHFSFSDTGSLIYVPGTTSSALPQRTLAFVDRQGGAAPLALSPGAYQIPRVSPTNKQIAVEITDGNESNIWIYDLSGTTSIRRLTFGGSNSFPVWSSDSERIVFRSTREKDNGLFWQRADGGTASAERLTKSDQGMNHTPESSARNGQILLYTVVKPGAAVEGDVWMHSLQDKRSSTVFEAPMWQGRASFSPDGRWVVYESTETGRLEVFVQPFPATGVKFQITKDGGNHPLWSPEGKEIFFMNNQPNGQLYSVAIQTTPSFSFGNPVALPVTGFLQTPAAGVARNYDITPDGKRFLVVFPPGQAIGDSRAALQIQVVLNWFEELQQRTAQR